MGRWLALRAVWGEMVPEIPICEGKSEEKKLCVSISA